jgi:UDP-glucose 4-epimerase
VLEGKVIITGAGGEIGSALASRLAKAGYDVLGLDRKPPRSRSFPWHYAELTDRDAVMRLVEGAVAVVHLGEIPNMWGPFSPDEIFATNTRIASTVFQAAAFQGASRIVYASSMQLYGCWGDHRVPPLALPLDEDHPPQPQSAYGLSKVANEGYLAMVSRQNPSIRTAALRFPGVIGSWLSWDHFVERMRAHADDRDGLGTYILIDDLCEAFQAALEGIQPGYRAYNVLADDTANLTPVHEHLAAVWPGVLLPAGHPPFAAWASNERIKQDTGWFPRHSAQRSWHEKYPIQP